MKSSHALLQKLLKIAAPGKLPAFRVHTTYQFSVKNITGIVGEVQKNNLSKVEILTCEERLCIQCIYIAPYDNESEALQIMVHYAKKQEFALDF